MNESQVFEFKRTAILNEEPEFLKDCTYVLNQHQCLSGKKFYGNL